MLHDELSKDARHMEEIAETTANRCDIWQDRYVYWISVALLHILTWILRRDSEWSKQL
jgi:hypothetical protein